MGSYRSRLEIVADVLSVVRGGARKTHVMYHANLSYALLLRYLRLVMGAGLVASRNDDSYVLTQRGREFLDKFRGYSERRKDLEKILEKVTDEKVMLETRFLSMKNMGVNCPSEQENREEKKGKRK